MRKSFFIFGLLFVVVFALGLACKPADVNKSLLEAAERGSVEDVEDLLEKGADVNAKDEFERTPLMLSALEGHAEVATLLVEAGADVNATAKYGQTALQFAEEQGNEEIAGILRAAGAGS
jgi:ankyrin repeat protein